MKYLAITKPVLILLAVVASACASNLPAPSDAPVVPTQAMKKPGCNSPELDVDILFVSSEKDDAAQKELIHNLIKRGCE